MGWPGYKARWNMHNAIAKASLTAHRHICATKEINTKRPRLVMDDSFSVSRKPGSHCMSLVDSAPIMCVWWGGGKTTGEFVWPPILSAPTSFKWLAEEITYQQLEWCSWSETIHQILWAIWHCVYLCRHILHSCNCTASHGYSYYYIYT